MRAMTVQRSMPSTLRQRMAKFWPPMIVLLLLLLGCSASDLVGRARETPTPTQVVVLVPTFTPSPVPQQTRIIVTPPAEGRPGVIIIPPGMDPSSALPVIPTAPPTETPIPTPTSTLDPAAPLPTPGEATEPATTEPATTEPGPQGPFLPTPTDTPPPPPTDTPLPPPTPTPTPYVQVSSGLIALRSGPGVDYPLIAQLGPDIPVAIIGRSEDGGWYEICCISGSSVWVAATHANVFNDVSNVPVSPTQPPPTPTPTNTPTETPTITPTPTATPYPFERAIGPQFFPTNNEYITIFAKLFIGTPPTEVPAAGYYLVVKFEGFERPNAAGNQPSKDVFEFSAPPGFGNRVEMNYKYEYRPPDPKSLDPNSTATALQLLGTGTWSVYVADGAGTQLSPEVEFTTAPSNPNRDIYIGWVRVR